MLLVQGLLPIAQEVTSAQALNTKMEKGKECWIRTYPEAALLPGEQRRTVQLCLKCFMYKWMSKGDEQVETMWPTTPGYVSRKKLTGLFTCRELRQEVSWHTHARLACMLSCCRLHHIQTLAWSLLQSGYLLNGGRRWTPSSGFSPPSATWTRSSATQWRHEVQLVPDHRPGPN